MLLGLTECTHQPFVHIAVNLGLLIDDQIDIAHNAAIRSIKLNPGVDYDMQRTISLGLATLAMIDAFANHDRTTGLLSDISFIRNIDTQRSEQIPDDRYGRLVDGFLDRVTLSPEGRAYADPTR